MKILFCIMIVVGFLFGEETNTKLEYQAMETGHVQYSKSIAKKNKNDSKEQNGSLIYALSYCKGAFGEFDVKSMNLCKFGAVMASSGKSMISYDEFKNLDSNSLSNSIANSPYN